MECPTSGSCHGLPQGASPACHCKETASHLPRLSRRADRLPGSFCSDPESGGCHNLKWSIKQLSAGCKQDVLASVADSSPLQGKSGIRHYLNSRVFIKCQIVVSCTYEEGKPALMQVLNTTSTNQSLTHFRLGSQHFILTRSNIHFQCCQCALGSQLSEADGRGWQPVSWGKRQKSGIYDFAKPKQGDCAWNRACLEGDEAVDEECRQDVEQLSGPQFSIILQREINLKF